MATGNNKMIFGVVAAVFLLANSAHGTGLAQIKKNLRGSQMPDTSTFFDVAFAGAEKNPEIRGMIDQAVSDSQNTLNMLGLSKEQVTMTESDQAMMDQLANTAGISAEEFVKMGNKEPEWVPHTEEEKSRAEEYMKLRRKRAQELKVTNAEAGFTPEGATVPDVVEDPNRTELQKFADKMLADKLATKEGKAAADKKAKEQQEAQAVAKREKQEREMKEAKEKLQNAWTNRDQVLSDLKTAAKATKKNVQGSIEETNKGVEATQKAAKEKKKSVQASLAAENKD